MTHRPILPPSRRTVRRVLGGLWLLDAALQAQPVMFSSGWWRFEIGGSVMAQPGWAADPIVWAVGVVAAHAAAWNLLFVAVQAALGLSLVLDRAPRAAIAASVPWAVGVWWVGEGLGMLPTGFAMAAMGAPGPVLLYPLIGILAWPGERDHEPVALRPALVAWVLLWAGQAMLQVPFVYPVRQALTANIEELSVGLRQWQLSIAGWMSALASAHPVVIASALAGVQILVGCAVLARSTRRAALLAGIAVSVFFWVCFQYLGGITESGATDPGTAPLMILLACALWPPSPAPAVPPERALRAGVDTRPSGHVARWRSRSSL